MSDQHNTPRIERARLWLAQALVSLARRTHPDACDVLMDQVYLAGKAVGERAGWQAGHAAARLQIAERMGTLLAEVQQ